MPPSLVSICTLTILLPAIAGIFRFNRVASTYQVFIGLIWIGAANEIISSILGRSGYSNAVNSNIYALTESFFILVFFRKLGLFDRHKWVFIALLTGLTAIWIAENFILSKISYFNSYFNLSASLCYTLASIQWINRLIIGENASFRRNPQFLICMAWAVYFTYAMLIEIFWIYGLNASMNFQRGVYDIMTIINLVSNIVFLIAILWMPAKRESTLL